jgi:metal-responsive CopG/Arc/MetJ family transcriptional regulator
MIKNVNFSIDEKIVNEFNILAKKNCLNKSKFIEKCIIEYIEKNKKKV